MSDYIAPIKDMTFVLNELAGLPALSQIPRFADSTAEMVSTVMDEAAKFASGVIAPLNEIGDNHGARCENNSVQESPGFADAYQKMVEGGWVALPCNPEYGGMGMPEVVGMAAGEMWTAANMSFALCSILGQGAINSIETHASDVLKAIYLEKMVSGEWTGSMNLTEPQAGSDLSVVRTKAERNQDIYIMGRSSNDRECRTFGVGSHAGCASRCERDIAIYCAQVFG
jgi:alkylation response protein AidB-like acyl-CoA dehydrogenase